MLAQRTSANATEEGWMIAVQVLFTYKVEGFCLFQVHIYISLTVLVSGDEGCNNGVHISTKMTISGAELLEHKIFSHFLTLK